MLAMNFLNKWSVNLEREHDLHVKVRSFLSSWLNALSDNVDYAAYGGIGATPNPQAGDSTP